MTNDYIKKEDQVITLICDYFNFAHGRFFLEKSKRNRNLGRVQKWSAFFINKYTKRSYEDIAKLLRIDKKLCMDMIGEVGFNIRAEEDFKDDFNALNIYVKKIYKNESSKRWKMCKDNT